MKQFTFGFLAALALVPLGVLAYLRSGGADVHADAPAPAWMSAVTRFAVDASVRRAASGLRNPQTPTDQDLIVGGQRYLDGCAGCHGRPGRPRRTRSGFSLPPEFALDGVRHSEAERYWIIKHGIRRTGMSAYGDYTERELWALADFVGRMKDLPPPVLQGIQPKPQ